MGRKKLLSDEALKAIREDTTSTIQELADWYKTSKVTIHAARGFKGAYKLTTPKTDPADFESIADIIGPPDSDGGDMMHELEKAKARFDVDGNK